MSFRLETETSITAKAPYERPSQPEPPEITDTDFDHIDLKVRIDYYTRKMRTKAKKFKKLEIFKL